MKDQITLSNYPIDINSITVFNDKLAVYELPKVCKVGALYLPETVASKEAYVIGIVLKTGEGYYNPDTKEYIPLKVKQGDIVIHSPYAGTAIHFQKHGEEGVRDFPIIVMRESDIFMVCKINNLQEVIQQVIKEEGEIMNIMLSQAMNFPHDSKPEDLSDRDIIKGHFKAGQKRKGVKGNEVEVRIGKMILPKDIIAELEKNK